MDESTPTSTPHQPSARERWARRIPALLLLAFVSFLYLRRQQFNAPKRVDVSALRLIELNGKPLPDSELHGKAVILNFWAPWCGPCRIETPWLQKLQAAHPNDLIVVGIVADPDTYPEAEAFMTKLGTSYPIVRKTAAVDTVFGAVTGLPTTFYIARQGQVVHTVSGLVPEMLMQHFANDAINR